MAISTLTIQLKWENENIFQMLSQLDAGAVETILEMDENSHMPDVWDNYITGICTSYFKAKLAEIGAAMKA